MSQNCKIEDFLAPGDTVLVHSEVPPQELRNTLVRLQRALGPTGTLIVPTFNYGFCSGKPYDHDRTPSEVGLFTEYVRRLPEAARSLNPIYSFAGFGGLAARILNYVGHSSFGKDSVFEKLLDLDAKIIFLNCSYERCTFVHYAEQLVNVSYRYLKYFTGQLTANSQTYMDTYDVFVRYLTRDVESSFLRLFYKETKPCFSAREIYDKALTGLRGNKYFLLAHPPTLSPPTLVNTETVVCGGQKSTPLEIVSELYPLDRTLVSDGLDKALLEIARQLPVEVSYHIETYNPTSPVWTWRVPERYTVQEAYLENENGDRIADYAVNPLHLVSYSSSVDKWISWEELQPHLHTAKNRPADIPWVFKYYERGWGFCVSENGLRLEFQKQRWHAVVKSEYITDPDKGLTLSYATLSGRGVTDELLICAHVCHPTQANDDAAGIAAATQTLRNLAAYFPKLRFTHMGVRFLFCPETIGSVCYFSQHPEITAHTRAAIFVEMAGTDGPIILQKSHTGDDIIDEIAADVLAKCCTVTDSVPFRRAAGNDEMVINGPGVGIPCSSLQRWPYPEYHTSADNLSIIRPEKLQEMADVLTEIILIYITNWQPTRCFKGPIFLSGYRLYDKGFLTTSQKEILMLEMDGFNSVWEISRKIHADYWETLEFVDDLQMQGLAA